MKDRELESLKGIIKRLDDVNEYLKQEELYKNHLILLENIPFVIGYLTGLVLTHKD